MIFPGVYRLNTTTCIHHMQFTSSLQLLGTSPPPVLEERCHRA